MIAGNTSDWPPLPRIYDQQFEAFSHKSLSEEGVEASDNDNRRISVLGKQALLLAVTGLLYKKTPLLTEDQLEVSFSTLSRTAGLLFKPRYC